MATGLYYHVRVLIVFVALFSIFTFGTAQGQPLTAETLWALGRVSLDDVSPDGRTALYGVTYYDVATNKGNRDLYIVPTNGGTARKITAFEGSEYNALYRPDGQRIGFLRGGMLWEMNPDGSDARQVSRQPMNGFIWSPEGKGIVFFRDVKKDATMGELYPDLPLATGRIYDELMYRHWDEWHDYHYSNVFFASYQDGQLINEPVNIMDEPFDSPTKPHGGTDDFAISSDGKFIVYVCKKERGTAYATSTNTDLYLYDRSSGKTTNLTTGMPGYDNEPVFSPDGKHLVWTSMATPGFEADRKRLMHRDMATGIIKELSEGLDMSVDHPQWSKDGRYIYFMGITHGTVQLFQLEVATRKSKPITSGTHNYAQFKVAGNDQIVAARMSMSQPVELYQIGITSGTQQQITTTNKTIWDKVDKVTIQSRMVKTTDGKDMLVWVILPPGFDAQKKYPTLLYCQGGPQSAVSQFFSYRWNFMLMASQGYVVVAPNRRGLPGFGQAWNDQISGDWGGQAMKDLLSAIDDVSREPWVDKDRRGAVGASFGGYSVYWMAGHHNGRFKSFISHCGTFNLDSWYGTTEELFFAHHDLNGAYWDQPVPATYRSQSPHDFVKNWDTPILVIHNEKDFRVPVSEGIQAFQAAQLKGLRSRFLYFPDEGHWVLKPQNSLLWQRVFFGWLADTL